MVGAVIRGRFITSAPRRTDRPGSNLVICDYVRAAGRSRKTLDLNRKTMPLSTRVESYKFWDAVTLWAKERLEHEDIVASALATAVVCDGLILNSIDPRWLKVQSEKGELKGYPYVGYCPVPGGEMMVLRAEALEHLLSIVREAKTPSREILCDEFIHREDFKRWLVWAEEPFPAFWFSESEIRSNA